MRGRWLVAVACLAGASCAGAAPSAVETARPAATTVATVATTVAPPPPPTAPAATRPPPPAPTTTTTTATTEPAPPATTVAPAVVEVAYRVERRTTDDATAGFEDLVEATLSDPRGWVRAGFRLVRRDDAPYLVVLAEGPEVDRLCLPHDTYGEYSCQRSEVVALNAERWREATPKWTGDLATYRRMLVNHEVGHLLGQPHPRVQCPRPGRPAPLMAQQSTELDGCLPNPWPLDHEVAAAARHDRPLAPL
ncbi:MAG: DUF3152 domain-containing protein [Actinomycetota bacterium]